MAAPLYHPAIQRTMLLFVLSAVAIFAQEPCDPASADSSMLCPVEECATDRLPPGCSYAPATAPFETLDIPMTMMMTNESDTLPTTLCCQRQCYAILDADPQTECTLIDIDIVVDTSCTRQGDICPIARCAAPPTGCEYKFDAYVWREDGTCCPKLCFAVDDEGNECDFETTAIEGDGDEEEEEEEEEDNVGFVVDDPCTPQGDNCPVARCAAPPTGCEYKFDAYVWREDGTCCPKLCFAVDSEGNECDFETTTIEGDGGVEEEEEEDNVGFVVDDPCTPQGDNCPVARCTEPPTGCQYKFDAFVWRQDGTCCPKLCFAVDDEGNECDFETTSSPGADGDGDGDEDQDEDENENDANFVIDDPCTPQDDPCPVAKCAQPPTGCQYKFDAYVWREDGTCCPKLCFAVDDEGNECTFETAISQVNGEEPDVGFVPNEPCASPDDGCPVARCAQPPTSCQYKFDAFVWREDGMCCPMLCFAVDDEGNECDVSPEEADRVQGDAEVDAGAAQNGLGSGSPSASALQLGSVTVVAVLLLCL